MRKIYLIFFILLFTQLVYAQRPTFHSYINTEYSYQKSKKDYQYGMVSYNLRSKANMLSAFYKRYEDMDPNYKVLHGGGIAYAYLGEEFMGMAVIASNSDKPYSSIDVTTGIIGVGYNVYSKSLGEEVIELPNQQTITFERKASLYLGVGLSNEAILYNNHIIPIISFVYQGDLLQFSVGIPNNFISFTPNKFHKFMLQGFINDLSISYTYSHNNELSFKFEYSQNSDMFRLSDLVKDDKKKRLYYNRDWIEGTLSYNYENRLELTAGAGYMLVGHYYYGKSFKGAPSRRLPHTTKYLAGLKITF